MSFSHFPYIALDRNKTNKDTSPDKEDDADS